VALPEIEHQRVEELLGTFCKEKMDMLQDSGTIKIWYSVKGCKVTLTESRPLFIDPGIWNEIKVAQFEYSPALDNWTLYWYDMKNRRQPYPVGRNKDSLEKLILEVEKDLTGIFWE
jgi:hypothetical protein